MGQERDCKLRYAGKTHTGKAYLETDYVLFRGTERLKIPIEGIASAKARGGALHLDFPGGPAVLQLGEQDASKWARKIESPPSRLDKLGVKKGTKIEIVGGVAADFLLEAQTAGAILKGSLPDLVFFAASQSADLRKIPKLAAVLPPGAALWVVYPKGGKTIREAEVIEAGRAAGLKDTKVARFSATHTALRFSAPAGRP